MTKPAEKVSVDDGAQGALKKQTRLGLEVKKDENLADWYSQVRCWLLNFQWKLNYFKFILGYY